MTYRKQNGSGDMMAILEHQRKAQGKKLGINKIKECIDWESFRGELERILGYHQKNKSKGGRPPFDPVFMLKVLILQKYYNLSDDALEEQIFDRASFMVFLDLQVGDFIPDAKTVWEFRQKLEREGENGTEKLFEHFEKQLTERGIIGREGSIVDASFVEAPKQRNIREENEQIKNGEIPVGFEKSTSKGRQKDTDARWTKKNKETHFGYKNHVKADGKTKLILKFTTTPANTHDSQEFESLIASSDEMVAADSAYDSEKNEAHLLECNAQDYILKKAKRNQPLSDEQKLANKRISRVRARIEHVFARLKHMGLDFVRTIGLKRAHQHNALVNLTYNMDRFAFLTRSST